MTTTTNLGITDVASNQDQKEVTINDGLDALDRAGNSAFTVVFTAHAATLSAAQYTRNVCFLVSDTAAATLTVPLTKRQFTVINSGSFDCDVGGASGAAVTVGPGSSSVIYCDGTSCMAVAGATGGGVGTVTSVAAGTGLAGGPITSAGTLSLAAIADHALLANTSGGSAVPVATTLTALIDNAIGSTQGDVLYRGGSGWVVLAPGSNGQVLTSGGAAANLTWTAPGSGTVTSIVAGAGLGGGTITNSGTLTANWNGGVVSTIGSGLALSSGTLSATGSGGSVTSVTGAGTVSGLTLSGTVTGAGTLTLGGALSAISLTAGVSGILPAANGGTGIANASSITVGGAVTFSGAFATTMTVTAATAVTLPTSGTLGYINIPQNSQSAAYTTVLGDQGKHLLHPSADTTARTFTIDSNANVAYPVGTAITFVNQNGGGVVTIAITTDTMRLAGAGTTGSRTLAANGVATAVKITSTEWIISGTGLT